MNFILITINLYFNIYSYIFIFLSLSLFLYLIDLNKYLYSSTNLNIIYTDSFKKINFYLFLSSLVGIPPLLGFFNKIFLFLNLLNFNNNLFIIIFLFINVFLLVFYLQQIRFIQSNFKKQIFFFQKQDNQFNAYYIIIVVQIFNLFSIFFLPIIFNNFFFYIIL